MVCSEDFPGPRLTAQEFTSTIGELGLAAEAYQKDNDLIELYFWDYSPDFYDSELIDAGADVVTTLGDLESDLRERGLLGP